MKDSKETSVILQRKIKAGECPIVNGVVTSEGVIYRIDIPKKNINPTNEESFPRKSTTTLSQLDEKGSLYWTTLFTMGETFSKERNIKVIYGEGGMGADGFIVTSTFDTDSLIWVAFFDYSNPFREVFFQENNLIAWSTLDEKWIFPLDRPEKVSVA